jgi:phage terminase large subunit
MLACYWVTLDTQGKGYVYKELYEPGHIVSAASKRIHDVNGKDKIYDTIAPPDMRNKQKDTGKSLQELFGDNGIWLTIASNNRVAGWLNLKEWLQPYDSVDIETGEPIKAVDLKIFDNCVNLIRSIECITKDEKDPNDCATEPHEVTHAPDALRYWTAGRPCPAKPQQKSLRKS